MEQNEVIPAVLGPSRIVMAGINGFVLAVADGANAVRADARLGQGFTGGQRATFAECSVVFICAALVAVAFDEQFVGGVGGQS